MDKNYVETLIESRNRAWEEAKTLLDTVQAEKRELSAEEEAQWTRINSDIDAKDLRIKELISIDEREAQAAEARSRFENVVRAPEAPKTSGEDEQLRALFAGETRSVEFRAMQKSAVASGGATVPTGFYDQLIAYARENSAIMKAGPTIITTDSGIDIPVPKVSSYGTAALTAEAAALSASDDTFATTTLKAWKYGILITVSNELLSDTGVDLLGYLAQEAGTKIGNAFGAHAITGTGTSQPSGIATGATAAVTAASAALTFDNLIDTMHGTITTDREHGVWIMKDSTAAYVRKLKDGYQNYLWQPSNILGQPDVLLGKAAYTDPNVAAIGTGAKSVLFGDPKAYFVRQVNGVRFERSDDYAFANDQVTFRALVRMDGALVRANGVVALVHA